MSHVDENLTQQYAERDEEKDRTPSAIVPEHKRPWEGDARTHAIVTPLAAPLKKKAPAASALSQQMQAEEPESHPQGLVTELVRDGMGRD